MQLHERSCSTEIFTYGQGFSYIIEDTALLDVHPLLIIRHWDSICSWIAYSKHNTESNEAICHSPFHLQLHRYSAD